MTKFQITSRAGMDMGTWEGATKAEALAKLHQAAGYTVTVEDDDVAFQSEEDARLCGSVDDWHFDEVAA